MRFDYTQAQGVSGRGPSGSFDTRYTRTELDEYVRCSERRVRDIELQLFSSTGERVGGTVWSEPQWMSFADHPMSATYFDLACAGLQAAGKI